MKKIFFTFFLTAFAIHVNAKNYFVAPSGDDFNDGTIDKPFATFGKAQSLAAAGDTVFFRQGIYHVSPSEIQGDGGDDRYQVLFHINKGGEAGKPIVFTGYSLERPTFDFSQVRPEGKRVTAIQLSADYIVLRQMDIIGVQVNVKGHSQSECVKFQDASHCLLQNLSFHDGMAIGIYMLGGSDNVIENCDAYNNYDNYSEGPYGGNVDGFGAHLTSETFTGNVFRYCRAWWNSDDGFDLINCLAPVRIENSVSFYNGYRPGTFMRAGDGTGFKAGGFGMKPLKDMVRAIKNAPQHVVSHCIAYHNKNKGVYSNHHLGGVIFENNLSIGHPKNYCMLCRKSCEENVDVPGYDHIICNNISLAPQKQGNDFVDYDPQRCTFKDNTTSSSKISISSFDPEAYLAPRNADGSLPFLLEW